MYDHEIKLFVFPLHNLTKLSMLRIEVSNGTSCRKDCLQRKSQISMCCDPRRVGHTKDFRTRDTIPKSRYYKTLMHIYSLTKTKGYKVEYNCLRYEGASVSSRRVVLQTKIFFHQLALYNLETKEQDRTLLVQGVEHSGFWRRLELGHVERSLGV